MLDYSNALFKCFTLLLEAEHDRHMKEGQTQVGICYVELYCDSGSPESPYLPPQENVSVRWDVALNKRRVAYFVLPASETELR